MSESDRINQALRFTTDDGLTLVGQVDGAGTGPLVVLLHGGGQTRHAWTQTAARLAGEGFDVARYDARGHGQSPPATAPYTLLTDLVAVLDQLEGMATATGRRTSTIAWRPTPMI